MKEAPLNGIRVIDLTQYAPGPYATRLLADLGAEVIKIEPPGGDPLRQMFKPSGESDSPVYLQLNKGKKIARLNLKSTTVVKQLRPLLKTTDVLIESFRPGAMDRLGLGWQHVNAMTPQLVYCSLTGYGQEGPKKDTAGHDINYNAAAGVFSFTSQPKPVFPLIADHSGGMSAVNSILAALFARTKTGVGAYLDISLYETILSWQYLANNSIENPHDNELQLLTGGAACYNIYQTKDHRFITLGALEGKFWKTFCLAVDRSKWIDRNHEPVPQCELINDVCQLFQQFNLDYWIRKLDDVDCCFEVIPLVSEIYNYPQTRSRGIYSQNNFGIPGKIDRAVSRNNNAVKDLPCHQLPNWNTR